jgi:hypothetical protein
MCRADMKTAPSSSLLRTLVLALVLALAVATGADAAIVRSQDAQGRTITFDVRAMAVDVDWYASVLRAAAHGNEISTVTIWIVPEQQIPLLCGDEAQACYTGRRGTPRIIISAGQSRFNQATLLHEYGHHLDTAWRVPGVPELNGTPVWWQSRGMASLLSSRRVAFDYSLGWSRSIGEIFAEDYAYIHMGSTANYGIPWLSPPDETLKTALLAELGSSPGTLPPATAGPLVITRNGTLAPRARRVVSFTLLGPGRHVKLNATVTRPKRKGVRARAQIVCNGGVVASQPFGKGRARRTLDIPSIGPAECEARLVSTTGVSLGYTLRLELTAPAEDGS